MVTIFKKPNGDRIVFDEVVNGSVVAHIEKAGGKKFASHLLENLLKRGNWEAVDDIPSFVSSAQKNPTR
jgi:hypothetical protein